MSCPRRLGPSAHCGPRRRQSGVVLFIALIVMVTLCLSGIALIRATDTGTTVTGNLAFKQASIAAVDRGIEHAVNALWYDGSMDRTADHPDRNYYACVRNAAGTGCVAPSARGNSLIPDRPAALASEKALTAAGLSTTLVPIDAAGNRVYYVVERMCLAPGPANAIDCNASAGSPGAFYRVTVRAEGPRETVTYAQAMLSDQVAGGAGAKHRVSWRILDN